MYFGVGFDPLAQAPAIIALVVGILVWRRHTKDRRARLFAALAASNLLLGVPLLLAAILTDGELGFAIAAGYIVSAGLVSAAVYLHFGLSFPHARPWLRRGRMPWVYGGAAAAGVLAFAAQAVETARHGRWVDGSFYALGAAALLASAAACVAIYRSYREMTFDERRLYRVPVMGVLVGMIAGMVVDVVLAVWFAGGFSPDNRYALFVTNVVATAAELLLPLFFFMAAMKYRLLEHHAQDYVAKL